jgi:tripartite-type tricarboxylate transporter receptor subunit TctC
MFQRLKSSVLLLAVVLCGGAPLDAFAEPWPTRPIRLVVPTAAGQTTDIIARVLADYLAKDLGQPIVIDNRPGASGMIGMEVAKAAPADGYTLVLSSTAPMAINPSIFEKMNYAPADFIPITHLTTHPLFLVTSIKSGIRDLPSLIAQAKASPGKLNYGSSGQGTTQQAAMEVFKAATGLDITHVPYKSAPQMNQDLIAGNIDLAFESSSLILPQLNTGRVTFIGASSKERSTLAPDVPSLQELGVEGYSVYVWSMLVVRKETPASIVAQLKVAVGKALANTEFIVALRNSSSEPGKTADADLQKMVDSEIAFWGKTMRQIGIHPK